MQIPFVNLYAQYNTISSEIDTSINKVLSECSFIKGKFVDEFEKRFAELLGVKHCIGVGNGTDALHISLKVLGISKGDEIIVPANTFIATSEAVTSVNAKVVFVDNDPVTYNIDTDKIEEKITEKTKAIIPVHLYGQPANMNKILGLVKHYNLKIIEDSAQAHLAEYKLSTDEWKMTGNFGDLATFSFYPGKNLGAYGDAGAIVTNDDELAEKCRMYANHGRISKYDHEFEGINSRLDSIQAAVLNVKLNYIKDWTQKRREIAAYYNEKLKNIPGLFTPKFLENTKPVWHLYVIRTKHRNELKEYLSTKGVSTGIHYPKALPNLQAYNYLHHKPSDFPIASAYQDEILSLPIYPELKEEHLEYIVYKVKQFFESYE